MLHPRPQLARDSFLSLNGTWELETGGIIAPVCVPYSPETAPSGFPALASPARELVYSRDFRLPPEFIGRRIILNFNAVDQCCTVYVNGTRAFSHEGGYLPFCGEITTMIDPEGINSIRVEVQDYLDETGFGYGKQCLNPHGIWYHAQSGIWQDVWLEAVPMQYVSSLRIEPDFDASSVGITVLSEFDTVCNIEIDGRRTQCRTNEKTVIPMPGFLPWSPEDPHLYHFTVRLDQDVVRSYFGMRKFSVRDGRLCLNNRPYFHSGVLDQGYWPQGLYTPPDDDSMKSDILLMKSMGFNTLRKHIKVESPRWYYHCDTIGMLVWQDLPSGGKFPPNPVTAYGPYKIPGFRLPDSNYALFHRENPQSRENCLKELREMVGTLYNTVCIAMWVPFNEGWGQFDSTSAGQMIRTLDPSRTVDNISGWMDQHAGQFNSRHVYRRPYVYKKDRFGRCTILSEFGGYSCAIAGHCPDSGWGYRTESDPVHLRNSLISLYRNQILPAVKQGLCGSIYTQLSDVETEINGLVTWDRQVVKVEPQIMKELNSELYAVLA